MIEFRSIARSEHTIVTSYLKQGLGIWSENQSDFNSRPFYQEKDLENFLELNLNKPDLGVYLLDSVVESCIYRPLGASELSSLDPSVLESIRDHKNTLARKLGFDNYFALYSRLSGNSIERIKESLTAVHSATAPSYDVTRTASELGMDLSNSQTFGSEVSKSAQSLVNIFAPPQIRLILDDHIRVLSSLENFPNGSLRTTISKEAKTVYGLVDIEAKCCWVVIPASYGGLEIARASSHAMGQAVHDYMHTIEADNIPGASQIETEALALLYQSPQTILNSYLPGKTQEFLNFLDLYFARLYCARAPAEAEWYTDSPSHETWINRLTASLSETTEIRFERNAIQESTDHRPLSGEFLLAWEKRLLLNPKHDHLWVRDAYLQLHRNQKH